MKINIGQSAIGGIPFGDPIISFSDENSYVHIRLEDFKNWINTIWESKGNRAKDAYNARDNLQELFNNILFTFGCENCRKIK